MQATAVAGARGRGRAQGTSTWAPRLTRLLVDLLRQLAGGSHNDADGALPLLRGQGGRGAGCRAGVGSEGFGALGGSACVHSHAVPAAAQVLSCCLAVRCPTSLQGSQSRRTQAGHVGGWQGWLAGM